MKLSKRIIINFNTFSISHLGGLHDTEIMYIRSVPSEGGPTSGAET
jgi:hypothetical protein